MLRLEGALWLRIILKLLLTPKRAIKTKNVPANLKTGWGRAGIICVFSGPDLIHIQEWATRTRMRVEELQGMAKAMEVLSGGSAQGFYQ